MEFEVGQVYAREADAATEGIWREVTAVRAGYVSWRSRGGRSGTATVEDLARFVKSMDLELVKGSGTAAGDEGSADDDE